MTCFFCSQDIGEIDYKDTETLRRFLSAGLKIKKREKTELCAKHQRRLATAIRRARFMGLIDYLVR